MNTHKAILGLDAEQAGVDYHLIDTNHNLLARGSAEASQAGLDTLNAALAKHHLAWADVLVGVEATGQWHLHWCEKLHALGAKVYAVNPLVAKRTSALPNAIRDNKTDPIDAAGLAELVQREHTRLAHFLYTPAGALFKLQRLQNARQAVREKLTDLKKSLGALRDLVFPELHALRFSDKTERAIIKKAPTPAQVLALETKELKTLARDKTAALRKAAAQSFASASLSEASASALVHLALTVEDMERQLERMDADIEKQAREALDNELLEAAQTLPGFGRKTTVAILSNIPVGLLQASGLSRRKLSNKIQAHMGADPRVRQSGKKKGRMAISKRGSRYARTALYQAAVCAVMNDPSLQAIYKALKARGKHHTVAMFDIARRLIRRLVAVIKSLPKNYIQSAIQPA